jgi:uncharacterized membrane protein
MTDFIVRMLVAGGIMGVIDAIWLSQIANKFYKSQIGPLLLDKPNMIAAVCFYVIYVFGIVLFAINPALEKQSLSHAALYGAALGGIAYATYDLTNLATLKGWSVNLVLVDIVWGMALTAAVASAGYWIVKTWI